MAVVMEIYRIAETPVLIAIPLFTFAGYLLGESGAPRRLVRVTDAMLDSDLKTAARLGARVAETAAELSR